MLTKALASFVSFLAVALTMAAAASEREITYAITLDGATYSESSDSTTFTYTVISNPQGGPAISHWVLGLTGACASESALLGANERLVAWTNSDPTTGMGGVKFDAGYDDQQTRTVELTLAGQWGTGTVSIAVKAGNGFVTGTVQGPICGSSGSPVSYSIGGSVFFDNNVDSLFNEGESGLGGFTVSLLTAASETVATTVSSNDGTYSFSGVLPGWYYVVVSHEVAGLLPTTLTEHYLQVSVTNAQASDTGYAIHLPSLSGMTANGYTIGFWKNNLEKALAGTTKGVQISAATLAAYTANVRSYALAPFSDVTLSSAIAVLSSTSSDPASLLAKQLLASEYNLANGAYLNGSELLTSLFIHHGEYVLQNASSYSASYVIWMKDWFDAYNNSHGGLVVGPTL